MQLFSPLKDRDLELIMYSYYCNVFNRSQVKLYMLWMKKSAYIYIVYIFSIYLYYSESDFSRFCLQKMQATFKAYIPTLTRWFTSWLLEMNWNIISNFFFVINWRRVWIGRIRLFWFFKMQAGLGSIFRNSSIQLSEVFLQNGKITHPCNYALKSNIT